MIFPSLTIHRNPSFQGMVCRLPEKQSQTERGSLPGRRPPAAGPLSGWRAGFTWLPLFLLLLLFSDCASTKQAGKLDLEKLDRYVEESMADWGVPGLALAIVKDDSVIFARGYGVREHGRPGPVDENTIFGVASITKGFTSSALAMLVDEKLIGWDDPVRKYLPDFTLYDPWVSNEMRIRDLLCHRSGLKTFSGDLIWFETTYSREEVLHRVRYLKPAHGFRYRFGYSNLMYLAAGQIIPAVTPYSWEDFLQAKILRPLGMNRTFLDLEAIANDANVASPHYVDLLDDTVYVLSYMKWDNAAPAGAMNSSAMDLSRWIRFQLATGEWNGTRLISRDNLWETRQIHTTRPVSMEESKTWPSRHFYGYGLGWQLFDYHGWKVIAHEGATDGMLSRVVMVPDENFGFVILTNSINALTKGLEYYILDQYFQGKSYDWSSIYLKNTMPRLEQSQKEWAEYLASADRQLSPSKDLKEYTGIYRCDMYGEVEVRLEQEGLVLDFLPSPRLIGDLETFSVDTFLITLRDMPSLPRGKVKFTLNKEDEVSELQIDIPNPDFDFTELELKKLP